MNGSGVCAIQCGARPSPCSGLCGGHPSGRPADGEAEIQRVRQVSEKIGQHEPRAVDPFLNLSGKRPTGMSGACGDSRTVKTFLDCVAV
jgi:hypothetical protein